MSYAAFFSPSSAVVKKVFLGEKDYYLLYLTLETGDRADAMDRMEVKMQEGSLDPVLSVTVWVILVF